VLISANPKAGSRWRRDRIQAIRDQIERAGFQAQISLELTELAGLAAEHRAAGNLRAVVAVGGDGTASVVRNQVPLDVPLLPVPMGTENLLGRFVEQGVHPADVCRTLQEGVTIGLDLGRAADKYFLLMFSAGFDAEIIRTLHEWRRGNINRTAYLLPTLRDIRSYAYPQMTVVCDNPSGAVPPECRWLFSFNLPLYGLGLRIAPDAVATDGLLDLCLFQRGSTCDALRYLWHVKRGRHHTLADTRLTRCRSFRVEGAESHHIAYQLDGDFAGTLPVEVDVLPGRLRLLVNTATARRLGFQTA
jgi:diacylglycerol kinase family enzyme